ncbi:MAG TPA: cytochrome c maturation protein CcmE [Solirubrobacteraceae bacterium]|nr:cytochrome c maturation protein CcmE [Solirubrobacteraceae bacterium]
MDPDRKRAIRMTLALTVALVLAAALVYTSFTSGRQELTASQLLERAHPGQSYILAGTVISDQRDGGVLSFRVVDPKLHVSVPVRYTGEVPDPFAKGRGVLVTVHEAAGAARSAPFVGEANSLTTKCPSKYQAKTSSD